MKLLWLDIQDFFRRLFCKHENGDAMVPIIICPDCGRVK